MAEEIKYYINRTHFNSSICCHTRNITWNRNGRDRLRKTYSEHITLISMIPSAPRTKFTDRITITFYTEKIPYRISYGQSQYIILNVIWYWMDSMEQQHHQQQQQRRQDSKQWQQHHKHTHTRAHLLQKRLSYLYHMLLFFYHRNCFVYQLDHNSHQHPTQPSHPFSHTVSLQQFSICECSCVAFAIDIPISMMHRCDSIGYFSTKFTVITIPFSTVSCYQLSMGCIWIQKKGKWEKKKQKEKLEKKKPNKQFEDKENSWSKWEKSDHKNSTLVLE